MKPPPVYQSIIHPNIPIILGIRSNRLPFAIAWYSGAHSTNACASVIPNTLFYIIWADQYTVQKSINGGLLRTHELRAEWDRLIPERRLSWSSHSWNRLQFPRWNLLSPVREHGAIRPEEAPVRFPWSPEVQHWAFYIFRDPRLRYIWKAHKPNKSVFSHSPASDFSGIPASLSFVRIFFVTEGRIVCPIQEELPTGKFLRSQNHASRQDSIPSTKISCPSHRNNFECCPPIVESWIPMLVSLIRSKCLLYRVIGPSSQ